jgi:hypothetical protein
MFQKTALIGMHTIIAHILNTSYVRTVSTLGPKFTLKCLAISDKILYWATGSLNDQRNTLLSAI